VHGPREFEEGTIMSPRTLRHVFLAMAISWALLMAGCGPVLDPTLSPPVLDKPIYNCAQTIAFSGADRDAKIVVYVNGTKVMQVPIWMGWGSIKLPSTLHGGDVVSAAQIVGNRISEKSRDPVTVSVIPAGLAPGGKLPAPNVMPPLYECQEVVRVNAVVQGATVTLRQNAATTWDTMTPYTIARFGVPALKVGDTYDAMDSLCKDPVLKSDWSATATVGQRPSSLAAPKIGQPLVAGNDAILLTDLVPGALVQIFADPGSGPVAVGSGAALDTGTIFKIGPPIDAGSKYSTVQALCDLKSPPDGGVTPVKDPPAPSVQAPLCDGGKYVTVCGTAVLSTVKVTMDGAQIAQGAGNGGCVKLGLGNATLLQTGKKVSAVQLVAGHASPVSADVIVVASAAPTYNPALWNTPAHQSDNNCYNYSTDIMTDTYAQPGQAHGVFPDTTCAGTGSGAVADGLIEATEKKCAGCSHLVALVISPGTSGCIVDYHWYRRDDTGNWSNKPGPAPASDLDASSHPITNPETADRKYVGPDYCLDYSIFCTYYCVDKSVVVIQ
jgi:hypothetical protein